MRLWLILGVLVLAQAARADDPAATKMLQARYDSMDAAMEAGDLAAIRKFASTAFVSIDLDKRSTRLTDVVRLLNLKRPQSFAIASVVESADIFDGRAKAAVRVTITQTVLEKGNPVAYRITKTEEDTWIQSASGWKLISARLTAHRIERNGRVILDRRENVLTDWERNYRRRSSSRGG